MSDSAGRQAPESVPPVVAEQPFTDQLTRLDELLLVAGLLPPVSRDLLMSELADSSWSEVA